MVLVLLMMGPVHAFMPMNPSGFPGMAPGVFASVRSHKYDFRSGARRQQRSKNECKILGPVRAWGRGGFATLSCMMPPGDEGTSRARSLNVVASSSDMPEKLTGLDQPDNVEKQGVLDQGGDGTPDQLFFSGTAFEFVLAAIAVAIGKYLDVSALGAGFDLSPESIGAGLLWTLAPLAFVSSIRLLELEELKEIEAITQEFAQKLFVGRSKFQLALFCFSAGFGEELLFRGIFHQKLELLFGFVPAASIVAAGFGSAHFLTPAYFAISGLSSFIFSYMFASSGNNIVVPVIAHAVYDYVALEMTLNEMKNKGGNTAEEKQSVPPGDARE